MDCNNYSYAPDFDGETSYWAGGNDKDRALLDLLDRYDAGALSDEEFEQALLELRGE